MKIWGAIKRTFYFFELLLFFFKELIAANIQVAVLVMKDPKKLSPGIIKVPCGLETEMAQVTLANMITLTPGTLTLDLIPRNPYNGPYLMVHVIHFDDADDVRKSIEDGFVYRLRRVFE